MNRGSVRTREAFRSGMGLLLLIGILTMEAIFTSVTAFGGGPYFVNPLLPKHIARVVATVSFVLFGLGGALVVSGRKPIDLRLSNRTVLGLILWIAVVLYTDFVEPFLLPLVPEPLPWYIVFFLEEIGVTVVAVTALALLTYNLQSRNGKILLWLASIVSVATAVTFDVPILRIFPYYPEIIQQAILAVGGLSTAFFAAAYFVAWRRVRNGLVTIQHRDP